MTIDKSKLGKQNKRKGANYERFSASFWSKILNSNIKRTPRSGAFWDWPGDIFDLDNSILKNFIIECKFGKTAVPKKIEQAMDELQIQDEEMFKTLPAPQKIINWMNKLYDESQGKKHFLEMSLPYKEPLIIVKIIHFKILIKEWKDYKKEKFSYKYVKLANDPEPGWVVMRRKNFAVILKDLNTYYGN